jgi:hypothetical protein
VSDNSFFEEKRRFPRLSSLNLVSYTHLNDQNIPDDGGIGRTRDLSKGGVTIQTHKPFPVNSVLQLDIALEERLISVRGQVIHVQKLEGDLYDIGICFTQIGEKDFEDLQKFFEKSPLQKE